MALNVAAVEDAWLMGASVFDEWLQKNEADWNAPISDTALKTMWAKLPPEVKAQLRKMKPEAYDVVSKRMEGQDANLLPGTDLLPTANVLPGSNYPKYTGQLPGMEDAADIQL